ncbi:MAG TPA: ABC transporter permease [Jatrophihabitans sp.]
MTATAGVLPLAAHRRRGFASRVRKLFGLVPFAILLVAVLVAIFAPELVPADPNKVGSAAPLVGPSAAHWLGTDSLGRDEFSRLLMGTRISVGTAVAVTVLCMLIGVPLGLLGGYLRGAVDFTLGRLADLILSFPGILLALVLSTVLTPSARTVIIALTVIYIPTAYRFVRGAVLAEMTRGYVQGARAAGAGPIRLMVRHVLPNISSPVLVLASSVAAFSVLAEAALSFLGFGAQPPLASWGKLLSDSTTLFSIAPLLVLAPGLAIGLVVVCLNLVGDRMRDRLDPRLRSGTRVGV